MKRIITTLAIFTSLGAIAQNNVGIGTLAPNPNAKLEIQSDDKGVLITRLTTVSRNTLGTSLSAVDDGMLVYDKDLTAFYYWDGPNLQWVVVGNGAGSDDQNIDNFTFDNTTNILTIQIEDGNSQTVDLTDLLNDGDSDPTNEIELPATATMGQVLSWDGTNWVAQNSASGADNWGNDIVNTSGSNITGDGTTANPLTVTDGDSDATNEIELPIGGTSGQLLSTDGSGTYTWVNDNPGTDNQNIANLAFDNTTNILTVGIDNGTSQTINLSDLVNDADSDVTNEIQDLSITNNILTITNNGSATTIDLSGYLDNTDAQTLTLTGNTLAISNGNNVTLVDNVNDADSDPANEIELPTGGSNGQILSTNGSGTYSWVNDGTGTDAQNIAGSSFTSSTGNLVIGISNGINQTINLNGLKDHNWYEVGTTRGADNINDNIFTQGNVGIGTVSPGVDLEIFNSNSDVKQWFSTTSGGNSIRTELLQKTNGEFNIIADKGGNSTSEAIIFSSFPGVLQENMRIIQNGNVGIGLTTPTAPLEVQSNNSFLLKLNNSANLVSNVAYQNIIGFFDASGTRMGYLGDGGPTDKVMQVVGNEDYAVKLQSVSALSVQRAEIYLNNNMDTSITFKTKNATRMFIEPNGDVGVGTTTPSSKLQVVDYYDTTMVLYPFTNASGNLPGISVFHSTDFIGMTTVDKDNNPGTTNDADGMIYWGDDGNSEDLRFTRMVYNGTSLEKFDKMIIKGGGEVGIGTNAPGAKLHVKGDAGIYPTKAVILEVNSTSPTFKDQVSIVGNLNSTTDAYGIAFLGDNHHRAGIYAINKGGTSNSLGEFHLWARGDGEVFSNNDFRVGLINPINSGSFPNYGKKLSLSGGPAPAGYDSENSDPLWFARYNVASDKSEVRLNIGDNNQVDDAFSIGYTSGSVFNERFRFGMTGVAHKPGGGTWTATSDRRTKKDIISFTDGLSVLEQINPVTFKYNGLYNTVNDGKNYVGIIAQEVKSVAPYMIGSYEATKTVESKNKEEILNYDGGTYMLYVLVNSVKEQQDEIKELKKELASQKQVNNEILEKLNLLLKKQ